MPEEKKNDRPEVSRRDFLVGAGAVVVSGAIGAGVIAGCGGGETTKTVEVTKTVTSTVQGGASTVTATTTKTVGAGETATITQTATVTSTAAGGTKTVTSTVQGGGTVVPPYLEVEQTFIKCLSTSGGTPADMDSVDVKNGKIVRIRPLHRTDQYTKEQLGLWTITARGKTLEQPEKTLSGPHQLAYKKRVYSPNRILYPLQRVDWEPGGDPAKINPQNRGKSKYKRITWDQATTIIANEINRVKTKYGKYSLLPHTRGHGETKILHSAHGYHARALNLAGGCCGIQGNPDSWEGWEAGSYHVWGDLSANCIVKPNNGTLDASLNCDQLLYWGCDPETTPWYRDEQSGGLQTMWYRSLGIKTVFVSPDCNYGGVVHADKWIPVLPNTDAAFHLAIAYTWLKEGTYCPNYLKTHAVGFEKFQAYVLGTEDGVPKTPEWASPLCGVPVWTIKAMAREWAFNKTSTIHFCGGSMIRGPFSSEPARMESYLLGMQGLGREGVTQIDIVSGRPAPLKMPSTTLAKHTGSPADANQQKILQTAYHKEILEHDINNPLYFYGVVKTYKTKYQYPSPKEKDGAEIHLWWTDAPCFTTCWNDGFALARAFRSPKLECIIAEHLWMEDDCLYADILLPINTNIEEGDIAGESTSSHVGIYLLKQAIPSVGESMSDYQAVGEVAKKLGSKVYSDFIGGKTEDEWIKYGYDTSGVQTMITWDDLNKKGYYVVGVDPKWKDIPVGMRGFWNDPVTNPLPTPTGKLEYYSQALADAFPDDNERGPMAKWITGGPGWTHDESRQGTRFKTYPLLIVSNHPRWRSHANLDDVSWLREIPTCKVKGYDGYMYEPVWIHPTDAAKRGIVSGDIVKIFNERGTVLGGAIVWERIIPGAVYQDHGARIDPIAPGIDRGGANNLISCTNTLSKNCLGMATSGFLVEVAKVTGEEMDKWRKDYPDAFARAYNPAYGPLFSGWIEGGM